MLLVRVNIVNESRTKVVKINLDQTVDEAIETIHKATKIHFEPRNPYALFSPPPSSKKFVSDALVSSLGISKLDTLDFKRDSSVEWKQPPTRPRKLTPHADALTLAESPSLCERKPPIPQRQGRPFLSGWTSCVPSRKTTSPIDDECSTRHRRHSSDPSKEFGNINNNNTKSTQVLSKTTPSLPTRPGVLSSKNDLNNIGEGVLEEKISQKEEDSITPLSPRTAAITRILFVEAPELQIKRTLKISIDETLEHLLTKFTKRTPVENIDDYALFLVQEDLSGKGGTTKLKLDRRKAIGTIENRTTLVLERTQVKVIVRFEGNEKELLLVSPPNITTEDLKKRIHSIGCKRRDLADIVKDPRSSCLFLPNSVGTGGTVMEPKRSVRSYRMTKGDFVVWKSKESVRSGLSDYTKEANEMFLRVEMPSSHGPTSATKATLKVKKSMIIADVINMFTKKHRVTNSTQYALFAPHTEKGKKNRVELQPLLTVGDYPEVLFNLATVEYLKKEQEKRGVLGSADLPSASLFGAQALTAETFVMDHGYNVPIQLSRLRKVFDELKGSESVGIFRLAGEEDNMVVLKVHFSIHEEDAHCDCKANNVDDIATLIKRWFGTLPKKLFGELISGELFEACRAGDQDALVQIPDVLPEPYRGIFLWLVDLLLHVASNQECNKMTTGNLAVVMSPMLTYMPPGNPVAGLALTSYSVAIFQAYLAMRRKAST